MIDLALLRIEPGGPARLRHRAPRDTLGLTKEEGEALLERMRERLELLQQRLYAEAARSVLLILQGIDASGKDGVIRAVAHGLSPLGSRAVSFQAPTGAELAHDYLWRVHAALPARGQIGIFNRSHYEDIVTVRVRGLAPEKVWRRRPHHVREWERTLADEGTAIVKVYLNVSKEKQRERLQERIDNPEKRWKFRRGDLDDRERFDDYLAAYDEVLGETSTEWAPWFVVPADRNWLKSVAVAQILVDALERLDPQLPEPESGIEGVVIP